MSKISRRSFLAVGGLAATHAWLHGFSATACRPYPGAWPSEPPPGCPFQRSSSLQGVYFTGRHAEYTKADTWYPSWASDDVQYSPFADGTVLNAKGEPVAVSCGGGFKAKTGYAKIAGNDPLHLEVTALGEWGASGMPYGGRYPCANLVHDGVWYYGTYCLDISLRRVHGVAYNWALLGPYLGCRISHNYGVTWQESPCTPWAPLFPQGIDGKGPQLKALERTKKHWSGNAPGTDVASLIPGLPLPKLGVMHFVDFGKNMEHSPDGKAYLVGHGAAPNIPHPRLGAVSWLSGDAIYLVRVPISPETVNDESKYEYFAGYDAHGKATWTRSYSKLKPMIEWLNHLGSATITYNPYCRKYFLLTTDGWPATGKFSSMLLESDHVAGPWKLVVYMRNFGSQGYFLNIPSKFLHPDGKTFWLCYSANFTNSWLGTNYPTCPPGSRYGMCLQEMRLT